MDKYEERLGGFGGFIKRYLPGKVQKLTISAGFMCPNRDGSKGRGGCIYCNNSSFSPAYTMEQRSITEQIEEGKKFFSRKYPKMTYLAYFQSYTSTNAEVDRLKVMYDEALRCDGIKGIVIGTRPDCMPQPLLDHLKSLYSEKFVMIEYGAESCHDKTLQRINRCHTWNDTADAVNRTAEAGLPTGLHLIMGLPGESVKDMLSTINAVNELPVNLIKCHQMQIIRGTRLHEEFTRGTANLIPWELDDYINLCCEITARLRDDIVIDRFVSQSPANLLVAPRWGIKNYEFTHLLLNRLRQKQP
ncbi:MAG: TIGR01212 family radical SAM protein [Paramuribaculum sp.]|nr:TIGR01212 family radical SAM protein [Paramuribaculum sp.]